MLRINEETVAEAHKALVAAIAARCVIAFAAGCRLAVSDPIYTSPGVFGFGCGAGITRFAPSPGHKVEMTCDFVILSPGEIPPAGKGWTIYEERDGVPQGRLR